ncbi:cytochrome d ubiquinol oxidase subunit II [Pseudomonas capeferrum]|uniref:cytochrome d ubiquinol oxidase subunit II n=1 Tax=Pseudomonas capeferrum TaxID=1495066 RepID=UPI0015E3327C|nr:cytochrome d ubiquinol oxidase subunit II [Pseudomonas capeferrum]MBA1204217.1 cytochrome d ubiquinol oxidase subunit II [Pseudomonas capeferrum]
MPSDDWIVLLSAAALAFSVLSYVLLDGTDLGVGMLLGGTRDATQRRAMALSILPVWDANETWLVLGGGGLLALFPMAYAILLPAVYLPFILMFLALIVRAMALTFRDHAGSDRLKRAIDALHSFASLLVGGCQGVVLGALVQGVDQQDGQYNGMGWEWLNAFALYCGLVLVVGYFWLGNCWLYWRTEGELHCRSRRQARVLALFTLTLLALLVAWTARLDPRYAERLTQPWLISPAVILASALLAGHYAGFRSRRHYLPLFCALGVFVLGFALMAATLFPLLVPPHLTLQAAASGPVSQRFMLVGFAILMPITLFYNTYGFRVFSGKMRPIVR